jgi:hypothetical protein
MYMNRFEQTLFLQMLSMIHEHESFILKPYICTPEVECFSLAQSIEV